MIEPDGALQGEPTGRVLFLRVERIVSDVLQHLIRTRAIPAINTPGQLVPVIVGFAQPAEPFCS